MKLLGWMHRKFKHNSGDVFQDSTGAGGTCKSLSSGRLSLDEYQHHRHQNHYSSKPRRSLCHPTKEEELFGEDEDLSENVGNPFLFVGFLSIGTLGSTPIPEEEEEEEEEDDEQDEEEAPPLDAPEESKFGLALKAIAEKQAEATTAEDLDVVTNELEKVLAAEAEKESSARPSLASCRPSAARECPLQGYLFGSPVEVAETASARRASLGELFLRSRAIEEVGGKNEDEEGREEKASGVVKRMMLKLHGSSSASRGRDGITAGSQTKFHKILQIFQKKVHPENTIEAKKSAKPSKNKNNGGGKGTGCCGADNLKRTYRTENTPSFEYHSLPPSISLSASDSNGNREHWIKTDADYLVLEL